MPMAAENNKTLVSLNGVKMNIAITAARLAYIPESNFGFEYIWPDQPEKKEPACDK